MQTVNNSLNARATSSAYPHIKNRHALHGEKTSASNHFAIPSTSDIGTFMSYIEDTRNSTTTEQWKSFIAEDDTLKHWQQFLSCDPYTRWGRSKPRGYAGDATLMDFAYMHDSINNYLIKTNAVGRIVYGHTSAAPMSESARIRTKLVAREISNAVRRNGTAGIASFASGHGREFDHLTDNIKSRISNFTAIDSDRDSLDELKTQNSARGVKIRTINKSAFRVGSARLGQFDLVYSSGLFDYLEDTAASRLIESMWACVKPGGRLVVGNLDHGAANLGYCEAIMDWWMITRDENQLASLADAISTTGEVASMVVLRLGCFNYLSIDKRQ